MFNCPGEQSNGTMFCIEEHRPAMPTKTRTTTTHYQIQKKRRAEFIEDWRKYRQSVIREQDVALQPAARAMRSGGYMGWDSERHTRCLDAPVHEGDPAAATTA